ncbi:hypothetical protein ACJX0J_018204 [Zea mays]
MSHMLISGIELKQDISSVDHEIYFKPLANSVNHRLAAIKHNIIGHVWCIILHYIVLYDCYLGSCTLLQHTPLSFNITSGNDLILPVELEYILRFAHNLALGELRITQEPTQELGELEGFVSYWVAQASMLTEYSQSSALMMMRYGH